MIKVAFFVILFIVLFIVCDSMFSFTEKNKNRDRELKSKAQIKRKMTDTLELLKNNRKKLQEKYMELRHTGKKKKKREEILKNISEIDKAIVAVLNAYDKMFTFRQMDKDYLIEILLDIISDYPLDIYELTENDD